MDVGMIILEYSWLIATAMLAIFGFIVLIVLVFLMYTNRLPVHWYDMTVHIRGKAGKFLTPRGYGKARIYKSKNGTRYLALRRWMGIGPMGFVEVQGIPFPADDEIYPDNSIELVQRGKDQYEPIMVSDVDGKVDLKYEKAERWKTAFRDMERDRTSRQKEVSMLLQLMPYGMIVVAMIGCFLIISVLATPIVTISGQAAAATKEYKEASEANLEIARLVNSGNGTVPMPDPEEPPPDA